LECAEDTSCVLRKNKCARSAENIVKSADRAVIPPQRKQWFHACWRKSIIQLRAFLQRASKGTTDYRHSWHSELCRAHVSFFGMWPIQIVPRMRKRVIPWSGREWSLLNRNALSRLLALKNT